MLRVSIFICLVSLIVLIQCSPWDDGKYRPRQYRVYDDGRYYRPLTEGKYLPGDEGKYTYIYQQGLYPDDNGDYRYIHVLGPDGGFGGNGGNGGFGGNGGNGGYGGEGGYGPDGPEGPDGPGGPDGPEGPGGPDGPNGSKGSGDPSGPEMPERKPPSTNNYIGKQIYAKRYPYIHKVIESLVDKYVSSDNFGEEGEGSDNHYDRKVYADKEIAVKCKYLMPNNTKPEFTTQYPPTVNVPSGENFGSYYSFRGTKVLSNSITSKLKLEYEVFVRVVEVDNGEDKDKEST